jgi:outer membrane protein assembly factor BamB
MYRLLIPLVCFGTIAMPVVALAAPDPMERELAVLRDADIPSEEGSLVDYFHKRTLQENDRQKVETLIGQLGDDSFEVRERATAALIAMGPAAEAQLKQAAQGADPEVKERAALCLTKLAKTSSPSVIKAAAVVLAARNPDAAADALFQFLPFAADESTADALRSALATTAGKEGKARKVLLDGLQDKLPAKRLGAALALFRSGVPEVRPAVLKLLDDPEVPIRLRIAMSLLESKERAAVPVLIDLIPQVKNDELRQIEDMLERIAQDKSPKRPEGSGDSKQLRDAWQSWWNDDGKKLDFAKLDLTPKMLGRTLILERGVGAGVRSTKVYEIDKDGKVLWQIDNLTSATDAHVIGDDRVLICESTRREVTERNFKGEVVWQYQPQLVPYQVQRLSSGNTLINCRTALLEVDKDGKEVLKHQVTAGSCTAAQRLKDGNIGMLTNNGQFTVISPEGKELKSFKVEAASVYAATILPDGGVLMAVSNQGKVLRYDPDGKVTLEATLQNPSSASLLPNGNVLVISSVNRAIIELDKDGKEVAKHTTEGRPSRAYGR